MLEQKSDDLPDLFHWAYCIQRLGDNAACCVAETVEYCKFIQDFKQEFLVICIRHLQLPTGHKAYLAIELDRFSGSPLDVARSLTHELFHSAKMIISSESPPAFDSHRDRLSSRGMTALPNV
jgi:hypothetical protein